MTGDAVTNKKLRELYVRRAICQAAIRTVDAETNDPRRPKALKEYQRQLANIDAKIAKIEGKPPDVVVGLKTAQIFGKVPK